MDNTKAEKVKRYVTAIIALSILTIASAVPIAVGIDDEAQNATITPEELFESIAGEWTFEGTLTVYNDTMPINGTRTVTQSGPSAELAIEMDNINFSMFRSIEWDNETQQLVMKEANETGYYNLTEDGYEGEMVKENGYPEFNVTEIVICKETFSIIDNTMQVLKVNIVNMDSETIGALNVTFKPAASEASEASTDLTVEVISGVVPAISITVATQNVDFGKVYAGTTSGNQTITVINTGNLTANISAMIQEDDPGFFNESCRLDGLKISDFTANIPADQSDFAYEYDILTNLEVPDWAQGTYNATIFFVTEAS
jgi:hypothetical protein